MFVKDRDRRAGNESWIPSLFAFFWIVLAGFAGAYIFKIVADEDLLNKEIAELTALGSEASAAQGLTLEERRTIIESRRAQDRTISELKDTVETLQQQVAMLTARLDGAPMPPAAVEPSASTPELPPVPQSEAETTTAAAPPTVEEEEEAPESSGAVTVSPPAASYPSAAAVTAPPEAEADDTVPVITASPATPQTDDPEADDEADEEDRSAAPQALAEDGAAEEETELAEALAPTETTVVEESETVTYGIPGPAREEPAQDETVRSLEMAAASDPGMKFGIEIGTVEEQKGLRPMWRDLLTKHAALVAGLEARRVMAPDKKWRLIAGPFANPVEATQACALFKKAELPCEATVFAGDSL